MLSYHMQRSYNLAIIKQATLPNKSKYIIIIVNFFFLLFQSLSFSIFSRKLYLLVIHTLITKVLTSFCFIFPAINRIHISSIFIHLAASIPTKTNPNRSYTGSIQHSVILFLLDRLFFLQKNWTNLERLLQRNGQDTHILLLLPFADSDGDLRK